MTADQSGSVAPSGDVFVGIVVHLIDFFVHSLLMDIDYELPSRRALVLETEGLVVERLRRMLLEEGVSSCLVDHPSMFHELSESLVFQHYVVGVRTPDELEAFGLSSELSPLLLLAPLEHGGSSAHYRMALPAATLLDRGLRDPDVLRGPLGRPSGSVWDVERWLAISPRQARLLSTFSSIWPCA